MPLTSATVTTIHWCDYCSEEGKETIALVDAATDEGPWADMCGYHFGLHGAMGLGVGRGQVFDYQLTEPEDRYKLAISRNHRYIKE